jgi:G6PDH family F420-dependent oxidoreductase
MAKVGYTLMTEQAAPKDLVRWAVRAEEVGFDLLVSSDHYFPWLDEQGHAPNAWVTLGAVAQVTGRAELMTYVTCPTMRYHPAVVAQQAATLAVLSDDRFTLGLGAGENLNEHVIGKGWPDADRRQEMLAEAVSIIRALLDGGYVNFEGAYFRVDAARIWDLPGRPVPLGVAVSGRQSCERFAPLADVMIAVEPDGSLAGWWDAASGTGQPARKVGQMPVCWGPDRDECIRRAHEQFRWFGGGWKVNAELPGTAGFAGATSFVRAEDVAGSIPCGDSVDAVAEAAGAFFKAGFTDLALVQIGGTEPEQDRFFAAAPELITAVKETAGSS